MEKTCPKHKTELSYSESTKQHYCPRCIAEWNAQSKKESDLIIEFINWLDAAESIGCCEDNIVKTHEPVQNFIDACVTYKDIRTESMGDHTVTVVDGSQRCKGDRREDMFILDASNYRLIYR